MGRGGRSRTQRKHFRQPRENVWKQSKSDPNNANNSNNENGDTWEPLVHHNAAFDEYYKEQGIVSIEEWDAFLDSLRRPLPAAFRINSSSQFCADIRSQLENEFMISLQSEVFEGDEIEAIRPLPWYPEKLAWHLNFSRSQLRKNQTLERFHEFLKLEHEIGNITRQEAVSMVPPLFLDVHPDHFVLDMCAAPGSKTFQLLEIIHQSLTPGSLPDGLVLANDLDVQRCNLLIHQTKRMCTANLIVTNNEAQQLPGCRLKRNYGSAPEGGIELQPSINQLLFDRVLCDVPCSGDGTLRKAPDIWRKWNAGMGNGLHSLQVQIAMRGISLLKIGGRLVYSTCSMNPVENEAVVAEILRRCGGCVELIDVSSELPQLIRRPGLRKWKVRDRGVWLACYKDVSKYRRNSIIPSMFPSGRSFPDQTETDNNRLRTSSNENPQNGPQIVQDVVTQAGGMDEEVSDFPLERCMRILPHDQNTGAFFIAVFHKISSLPANQEIPSSIHGNQNCNNKKSCGERPGQSVNDSDVLETYSADDANEKNLEADVSGNAEGLSNLELEPCDDNVEQNSEEQPATENAETAPKKAVGRRRVQSQGRWRGVDPVVFFKDETVISSIKTFYGIKESFPFEGHLITRNSDTNSVKRIYYISKVAKDVLELNFKVGEQLKIASVGLKMFERQSSREGRSTPCAFRISSEGLPLILPYITKQILYATPVDFKNLLLQKSIRFADFADAEFSEKATKLMPGCCVIVLNKGGEASYDPILVDESTIAIGCWKGRASMNVMVTAMDCEEMLERLSIRLDSKTNCLIEKNKHSTNVANGESEECVIKAPEDVEKINSTTEG